MSCRNIQDNLYFCVGKNCPNNSPVYGTNPYTSDSSKCQAAKHSGIIKEQPGYFNCITIPNQQTFLSST